MRKLIFILILLFATNVYGAAPTRSYTYTSGETISSTEVTQNEDNIFNYLQSGVSVYADGTIVNADVATGANIQSDKINLSSLAQDIVITSAGSLEIDGTLQVDGTSDFNAAMTIDATVDFNDTVTFGGVTITDLGTVTTAAFTAITNLGTVTTADINGGTLDGVNIGTETATGMLIVNNSSNDADGLGSQGTEGQYLQSAGSDANPTWANPDLILISATAMSAATNSGDISISASKSYKLIIDLTVGGDNSSLTLRVNSDSGNNYNFALQSNAADGSFTARNTEGMGVDSIELSSSAKLVGDTKGYWGEFHFNTREIATTMRLQITGTLCYENQDADIQTGRVAGQWIKDEAIASFEILASTEVTGTIYLYELVLN